MSPATAPAVQRAIYNDLKPTIDRVYMVIQRAGSEWTPASKILHVMHVEVQAEDMAAKLKMQYPHQNFGVAALISEARPVPRPVEIVRLRDR